MFLILYLDPGKEQWVEYEQFGRFTCIRIISKTKRTGLQTNISGILRYTSD